jgi:hypothetical protein
MTLEGRWDGEAAGEGVTMTWRRERCRARREGDEWATDGVHPWDERRKGRKAKRGERESSRDCLLESNEDEVMERACASSVGLAVGESKQAAS